MVSKGTFDTYLIKFFTNNPANAKIVFVGISDYISFEMNATIQLHSTFPDFIIKGETNERVRRTKVPG